VRILCISDLSAVGNNSLVANISILTALGHKVHPLATGVFSRQTAFPTFHFFSNDTVEEFYNDIAASSPFSAVLCGFLTGTTQLHAVKGLLERSKAKGDIVIVDPIMGDNGALYRLFDSEYVSLMKDTVRDACCITPNLTEACLLCDVDYDSVVEHCGEAGYANFVAGKFAGILQTTGAKSAVITGVATEKYIYNFVFEEGANVRMVSSNRLNGNFSGTGDVFCSVLFGKLLNGATLYAATAAASLFVYNAIAATAIDTDPKCGCDFNKVLGML
jgi:pyridoxine kinase